LSEEERAELNRYLLENTLSVLGEMEEIEQALVVSRDPAALAIAREYGARTVQEEGSPQLNKALTRATVVAQVYKIHGVLILPADLPMLNSRDLQEMIRRAKEPPVVVIAPDRRGDGTNALLIAPAGLIEYDYGPHSFKRHCKRARQAGARLEIVQFDSLALDLDLPEDLTLLKEKIPSIVQEKIG
jgi:2-phospho-L-lactate guanylyltransferase